MALKTPDNSQQAFHSALSRMKANVGLTATPNLDSLRETVQQINHQSVAVEAAAQEVQQVLSR